MTKTKVQNAVGIFLGLLGSIVLLFVGLPIFCDWSLAAHLQKSQAEAIFSNKRTHCVWIDAEDGRKYVNDIIDRFTSFDGTVTAGNVTDEYPRFFSESGQEFELSWTEMTLGSSVLVPKDTYAMYVILTTWKDGAKKVRKALKGQVPMYGTSNED